jgi:hypothetical protein
MNTKPRILPWLGLGLLTAGLIMFFLERRKRQLGNPVYRGGHFEEAPVVGSYTDGNMTTVLRHDHHMTIEQRIASIQKQIAASVQDPQMRALAIHLTRNCPERDGMCEAKAIYKAVRKRVRYTGDVATIKLPNGEVDGIDLYQSARRTWEMGGGDCDDGSILIGTLASVIGLTTRLRTTAEDPNGEESHIYPAVLLPKFNPMYAVALDTTLPGMNKFGVELPAGKVTDYDA